MTLRYAEESQGEGKTTSDSDVSHVQIDELVPGERVVWGVRFDSDDPDNAGRMTMTWTFTPRGGTTRVAIDATDVPPGIDPDAHQQGLDASQEAGREGPREVGSRIRTPPARGAAARPDLSRRARDDLQRSAASRARCRARTYRWSPG